MMIRYAQGGGALVTLNGISSFSLQKLIIIIIIIIIMFMKG